MTPWGRCGSTAGTFFVIFTPPGLLLTWLVWRTLPRDGASQTAADGHGTLKLDVGAWKEALAVRNVRIAMAMMLCWLSCLITTSALLPSYLVDHLRLPMASMAYVMSAIGIGAMAGTLLLSAVSDRIGRKPVMILASVGALAAVLMLMRTGADPVQLFVWLFLVHFFNNSLITLTVGPVCLDGVPARLFATTSGLVVASGELLGGFVSPVAAGFLAERFGIATILWLPVGGLAIGIALSLALDGAARTRLRQQEA